MAENTDHLVQFMARVWNDGDLGAVDEFVAAPYTIHSDPGDPWDGQTLSVAGFKERLLASRAPFSLRVQLAGGWVTLDDLVVNKVTQSHAHPSQ